MGFLPDLEPHLDLAVPSARVYADAIEFTAGRWDAFMSRIQSESAWDVDMVDAGRLFVGLGAVDLGLRLFALDWIAGGVSRPSETPLWAEENGVGRILRSRLAVTGFSRGQLAARLGVSATTVDNWLDGRYWPDRKYLDSLALEFAGGDPDVAGPLAAEICRQFALAKLCHVLSENVGREHVLSAVDAVFRFARHLSEHVAPKFLSVRVSPCGRASVASHGQRVSSCPATSSGSLLPDTPMVGGGTSSSWRPFPGRWPSAWP